MEEVKYDIIAFPRVKNYHTVKLEEILTEAKIIGNGIVEEINFYKRECRVNFIGKLEEIKASTPIGIVCEKQRTMILLPKAEISIQNDTAEIKWHEIKRRKRLAGYVIFHLVSTNK